MRAYLAGQRALQERLAADTGLAPDAARAGCRRCSFAWDWLSLGAVPGLGAEPTLDGPVALRLGDGLTLDPWPFAPRRR